MRVTQLTEQIRERNIRKLMDCIKCNKGASRKL